MIPASDNRFDFPFFDFWFPNLMNCEFFGLSERRFEMFPKYSSSGIIIANMDDVIHNFSSLVVDQGHRDQPITEDLPQG